MEQVISIVVRNQPGVLMRVAGLFSRRGYNIDSLAVGITQNPEFSRMTVTMQADEAILEQVCKQLDKLVEVEAIQVLPASASSKRSMALVKVQAAENKMELIKIAEVFRAHAIDVAPDTLTFLITGINEKIYAFVDVMKPYGILEMVQTGEIALERGATALDVQKSRYKWPKAATQGRAKSGTLI